MKSVANGNMNSVFLQNGVAYYTGTFNGVVSSTPFKIPDGPEFVNSGVDAIASGLQSVLMLKNGVVFGFGLNGFGALGTGDTNFAAVPVKMSSNQTFLNQNVTAINMGPYASFMIENGVVYACGANNSGQLGVGQQVSEILLPTPMVDNGSFVNQAIDSVRSGNQSTLILTQGTVYAVGDNGQGQLGNPTSTQSLVPIPVLDNGTFINNSVTTISSGPFHSLVIRDGVVYSFGFNSNGQLGIGSNISSNLPVPVSNSADFTNENVSAIQGSELNSAFLKEGTIYAVGSGLSGILGIGNTTDSLVPVRSINSGDFINSNIIQISSYGFQVLAVRSITQNVRSVVRTTSRPSGTSSCSSIKKWVPPYPRYSYRNTPVTTTEFYGVGSNQFGELGIGNQVQQLTYVRIDPTA